MINISINLSLWGYESQCGGLTLCGLSTMNMYRKSYKPYKRTVNVNVKGPWMIALKKINPTFFFFFSPCYSRLFHLLAISTVSPHVWSWLVRTAGILKLQRHMIEELLLWLLGKREEIVWNNKTSIPRNNCEGVWSLMCLSKCNT